MTLTHAIHQRDAWDACSAEADEDGDYDVAAEAHALADRYDALVREFRAKLEG